MELGIVEGLFDMCEKYFGEKATKALVALIVFTIVCMCFVFITSEVAIPIYRFIKAFAKNNGAPPINIYHILWGVLVSIVCGLLAMILYQVQTWPIRRDIRRIKRKVEEAAKKNIEIEKDFHVLVSKLVKVVTRYNEIRIKSGDEPFEIPTFMIEIEAKQPSSTPDRSASRP
jgi:hypothetical protein